MGIINFYLFESETDLLDKVDKVANIVIALFTLGFSIYIYISTRKKEEKNSVSSRKIDFLKTIVLENNMVDFFSFHEEMISALNQYKGTTLTSNDKVTISILLIDKLTKFRYKFYDLLLPFDRELYNTIKTNSDDLVDELTRKINSDQPNYLSLSNFQNEIEALIINSRNNSVTAILNFQ